MVRPKKQSKRVPVRLRHKIEKKVNAKAKKSRKLAKKDPTWKSRLKKDPGIPNLFPFKDKVLAEIEAQRRSKEEEKLRQKELAKEKRNKELEEEDEDEMKDVDENSLEEESNSDGSASGSDDEEEMEIEDEDPNASGRSAMAALLASARERAAEFEGSDGEPLEDDEEDEDGDTDLMKQAPSRADSSLRSFSKHFQTVISSSDVILYVLDARDPAGTRSQSIEQQIRADDLGSKRLILLLNKIDLVPTPVLKSWLVYLRRFFPTLPIRASKPASGAKTYEHHSKELTASATAKTLVNSLKSFAKTKQLKRAVTVGVVGFPNVGKSSVINAILSRGGVVGSSGGSTTACPVGAEAGVTTSVREVKLDSKLKLLDSPGIVFPKNMPSSKRNNKPRSQQHSNGLHISASDEAAASLTLLNALPPKLMPESTVPAVSLLLSRLKENPTLFSQLTSYYSLPPLISSAAQKDLTMDFLVQVARKKGRLGKGGVPNIESAARAVVTDWRDGRISGWTEAPVIPIEGYASTEADPSMDASSQNANRMKDQKEIVQEWAAEFKIEGLWGGGEENEDENAMAD